MFSSVTKADDELSQDSAVFIFIIFSLINICLLWQFIKTMLQMKWKNK